MKALFLEYYKIRRRKSMGDADAFFLAAELGWASMSMSISISRSADNATWEALIFSLSSMNGLFLPILSAIVVSRICDMEHKGDTWKNADDHFCRTPDGLCRQIRLCRKSAPLRHSGPSCFFYCRLRHVP
ncbi:ABC transporter permease [Paenibacillus rhizoplanae]